MDKMRTDYTTLQRFTCLKMAVKLSICFFILVTGLAATRKTAPVSKLRWMRRALLAQQRRGYVSEPYRLMLYPCKY
jgi:hypothetical protein